MKPVEILLDIFGSGRELARALKRHPACVTRWRKSGHIPRDLYKTALKACVDRGHPISLDDVIFGRIEQK